MNKCYDISGQPGPGGGVFSILFLFILYSSDALKVKGRMNLKLSGIKDPTIHVPKLYKNPFMLLLKIEERGVSKALESIEHAKNPYKKPNKPSASFDPNILLNVSNWSIAVNCFAAWFYKHVWCFFLMGHVSKTRFSYFKATDILLTCYNLHILLAHDFHIDCCSFYKHHVYIYHK